MVRSLIIHFIYILFITIYCNAESVINEETALSEKTDFLLLSVATNETDGYKRFINSVLHYGVPYKVLGMHTKWLGGDMNRPGGGYKINLVKKQLGEFFKNDPDSSNYRNTVIMFTDAFDTVLLATVDQILEKFEEMDASIVFSAESFCWPDSSLASAYPSTESPYKYLNSGGYIGNAYDLYTLFRDHVIDDEDDDQLFLSKLFIDKELREKYRMRLDTKAVIFQNLHGASYDVKLKPDDENPDEPKMLLNTRFMTIPLVVHGNGLSKLTLNSLANYLAGAWHPVHGCGSCREPTKYNEDGTTSLPSEQIELLQSHTILLSIFISKKTPFLQEFFDKIFKLNYPKSKIHFYLYNSVEYHEGLIDEFLSNYGDRYISIKRIKPKDFIDEKSGRTFAIERCIWKKCGYMLIIDSIAQLDSPEVINALIKDDKGVVGPLLVRPFKAWSNFWGAINSDGFYQRSFDYMEIVSGQRRGVWNVPYLTHCYLVNATLLPQIVDAYQNPELDAEMSFCNSLRKKGIFMYVDNLEELGHLVDNDGFDEISQTNPEFYQIFTNQLDWEKRYIHPDYYKSLEPGAKHKQPCPDVYWFPIVTQKFCSELIEIMETFGKWSSGLNKDDRITGGYENVPTRDIHMKQVGLERHWLHFLKLYIRPLQEAVFTGYYHDPPESIMNFVVRYKPDEQPSLRPHHDSSTYTINIALNTPGTDYQGGGCKFIRYNCSVTETKMGWVLMHPGRLTHYHEGLPVTSGTRYIMISFVNP